MLHCISVRHESIGFEPQIDGKNDAGDYGGGAHDVCGNLAGDGRGDVPATAVHSRMAAGQSTAPWMMNTTEALMFAPVPIRVFNALILWNGPILAASSTARAKVPAPAPK